MYLMATILPWPYSQWDTTINNAVVDEW